MKKGEETLLRKISEYSQDMEMQFVFKELTQFFMKIGKENQWKE